MTRGYRSNHRLSRYPLVEVVPWFEELWSTQPLVVQNRDLETCIANKLVDCSIQIASATDTLLEAVESVLLVGDCWISRQAMFEKIDLTAGTQHSVQLTKCPTNVRNRAQGECAQSSINGLVTQREYLSVKAHVFDLDGRSFYPFFAELAPYY